MNTYLRSFDEIKIILYLKVVKRVVTVINSNVYILERTALNRTQSKNHDLNELGKNVRKSF